MPVARPDWSGQTVVCIASGPSLTPEDCDLVRASGHRTIVTNSTIFTCPWAHALFAFDFKWWQHNRDKVDALGYSGERYSMYEGRADISALSLANLGWFPPQRNSGACAVTLAIAAGAKLVIMLGFDCKRSEDGRAHHHPDHGGSMTNCVSIAGWPRMFHHVGQYAMRQNVPVVNCTRDTALTCFHRLDLAKTLREIA